MSTAKILIVEDESIVALEIKEKLVSEGYVVVAICTNAEEAHRTAINNDIDLILMDIALTDSCGIEASKKIKSTKDVPIVFLSAFMDEETIDRAIEVNPVAYLTKPFSHQDLLTAIKIGLKNASHSYTIPKNAIKIDNEFSFCASRSQLFSLGEPIRLTKKEKKLLQLFLDKPNQLISSALIDYVIWPESHANDNARRVLISRLRAKLKHKFIDTYSMEGYMFIMKNQ